jgi:integrase
MSGSVYRYTLKDRTTVRWGFAIDLAPRYDPETGRHHRQQLRRTGYRRKLDAEAALEEEAPGVRAGTALSLEQRQRTVGDYAATWAAGKVASGKWRPTTERAAGIFIKLYIVPAIGRYKLGEVSPDHIRAMLSAAAAGKRGSGRPLGARSLNQLRMTTGGMLAQAERDRLITWNPVTATDPVRVEAEDVQPWSTAERDRFLALVADRRPGLHAGLVLSAMTGIRRGELAALLWSDVDLDNRRLRVERTAYELRGKQCVGPPKSKRSRRAVPFGQDVAAVLRAHRRQQAADRLAAHDWAYRGLVICDDHGGPIPLWALSARFRELAREAGLGGSLHVLRHTSVCVMLRAGVPPDRVAVLHGDTLATIMSVYAHYIPDELNRWADVAEAHRDAW